MKEVTIEGCIQAKNAAEDEHASGRHRRILPPTAVFLQNQESPATPGHALPGGNRRPDGLTVNRSACRLCPEGESTE